jgi:uncharacterized membrane protein
VGRRLAVFVLIVIAVAWGVSLLAAPLMTNPAVALLYAAGSLVCHQLPDRSFHVAGVQLPVCARCAALYWGGAAGLMAWLFIRPRSHRGPSSHGGHHFSPRLRSGCPERQSKGSGAAGAEGAQLRTRFKWTLLLFGAPVAISVATATVGVWDPSNIVRAMISAPLGIALGALLAAVTLEDLR